MNNKTVWLLLIVLTNNYIIMKTTYVFLIITFGFIMIGWCLFWGQLLGTYTGLEGDSQLTTLLLTILFMHIPLLFLYKRHMKNDGGDIINWEE